MAQTNCLMNGPCSAPDITFEFTTSDDGQQARVMVDGSAFALSLTRASLGEDGAMSVYSYAQPDTTPPVRAALSTMANVAPRVDLRLPVPDDTRLIVARCQEAESQ